MTKKTTPMLSDVKWKEELDNTAYRFHVLACWVAVIFNPLWAVSDYYVSPSHFKEFLILRLIVVALIFILSNGLHKYFKKNPAIIALIPLLSISFQNAWMYSVMNVSEFQTHTFAYITLFIGAAIFVLWEIKYSIAFILFNVLINVILFKINSPLGVHEILINGGFLIFCVAVFSVFLIQLRIGLTKKEIISRLALAESNEQLAITNKIIEQRNREIKDSINYAQQIQQALLALPEINAPAVSESFIFFVPKDTVSGDFYWSYKPVQVDDTTPEMIIAAADCTGHGVPGAMVSIVCNDALNKAVHEFKCYKPGEILDKTRLLLEEAFSKNNNQIQDGMDISLLSINTKKNQLQWAGAHNSLIYVSDGQLLEIKPSNQPVGKTEHPQPFYTHSIPLHKGDVFYLFTDGYADQFGGPNQKKFKLKKFKEMLLSIASFPMAQQYETIAAQFSRWKGTTEQTDDICVIGIKL